MRRTSSIMKPKRIMKADPAASVVLRLLRSFLDANEPELIKVLVSFWRNQGKAITYKEIREAILSGDIDPALLEAWQQDYTRFVVTHLQPAWRTAIETAASEIAAKYPEWYFNPMAEGVRNWTDTRAAEFVTSVTDTQIEGIRAVVQNAAALNNLNVDQLARVIRPMVSLTKQQSIANLKYYENLIANGVKEKRALDLSLRYSARQHRYRGMLIARSELAYAYNRGAYEAAKQAQEKGYMGECVKVWITADDERTCPTCSALDGEIIGLDDEFNFKTKLTMPGIKLTPPLHPSCRCGFQIKEIAPPNKK